MSIVGLLLLVALVVAWLGAPLAGGRPGAPVALAAPAEAAPAGPQPGEVFRQVVISERQDLCAASVARCTVSGNVLIPAERTVPLTLPSLASATRAELAFEYWGGHIATRPQEFRVNGGTWQPLPQPAGTPAESSPLCYLRTVLGHAIAPLSLAGLGTGGNTVGLRIGVSSDQSDCVGAFGWGLMWIYGVTTRIYYDPATTLAPSGQIVDPLNGAQVGENPTITVAATAPAGRTIARVDLIGRYLDFDWDGNGVLREWQYRLQRGEWTRHIGADTTAPYTFRWDTAWVPDQDEPVELMARITDSDGVSYMTPAVQVLLKHSGRRVRLYTLSNTEAINGSTASRFGTPRNFSVRAGQTRTATISIPDSLAGATRARLIIPTWGALASTNPAEEPAPVDTSVKLNSTLVAKEFGLHHDHTVSSFDLAVDALSQGDNTFLISSTRQGHALEVNWPGPALLVEWPRLMANALALTTAEDTSAIVRLSAINLQGRPLTYTVTSGPSFGRLTGTGNRLTYIPGPNFYGADSLSFTVTDDAGGTDTATVAIEVTPVNDPPAVTLSGQQLILKESGLFTGQGSFSDVEPGTWTATVDYGDGGGPQPLTLGDDGTFTLQHSYTSLGKFTVTVRVTDDLGAVGEKTLPIQVIEQREVVDQLRVYLPFIRRQ